MNETINSQWKIWIFEILRLLRFLKDFHSKTTNVTLFFKNLLQNFDHNSSVIIHELVQGSADSLNDLNQMLITYHLLAENIQQMK